MLYNVIGYDNQVIGQVEADNPVEAWSEAGKKYEYVLDVREEKRPNKTITKIIVLTLEIKVKMLDLCRRAYAKESEFGMSLGIEDNKIIAGKPKWGRWETIELQPLGSLGGTFHIHHCFLKYDEVKKELVITDPELEFSFSDLAYFLIRDDTVFDALGTPQRTYIKWVSKVKKVPNEIKEEIKGLFPYYTDKLPSIQPYKEYYTERIIHLDDNLPSYIEVFIPV